MVKYYLEYKHNLTPQQLNVLMEILDTDPYVDITTNEVYKISKAVMLPILKVSDSAFRNLLSALRKKGALIKKEGNTYINPRIIFRGEEKQRELMIKLLFDNN